MGRGSQGQFLNDFLADFESQFENPDMSLDGFSNEDPAFGEQDSPSEQALEPVEIPGGGADSTGGLPGGRWSPR